MNSTTFKKTLSILSLGLLALAAGGARADWGHGPDFRGAGYKQSREAEMHVNARQAQQMTRIQSGFRSGALTQFEYRDLLREQDAIREMERRFLADSRLDPREYMRLDQALDTANRNIADEKHDRQAQYRGTFHRYN